MTRHLAAVPAFPPEEPLPEWEREFLEAEELAIELLGHAEYMRRQHARWDAERRLQRR